MKVKNVLKIFLKHLLQNVMDI